MIHTYKVIGAVDSLELSSWKYSITFIVKSLGRLVFGYSLHHWIWKLFGILYCVSTYIIIRKKQFSVFFLLYFPLLIHIVLSSLELYPFAVRLLLYETPLIVIALSIGIGHFSQLTKHTWLSTLISTSLVLPLIPLHLQSLPIADRGIRPAILHLIQNAKDNDVVYVYNNSKWEYDYYQFIHTSLNQYQTLYGRPDDKSHGPFNNKSCMNNRRVWAIFSDINLTKDDETREYQLVEQYFTDLSHSVELTFFPGSAIHLFNLKGNISEFVRCFE